MFENHLNIVAVESSNFHQEKTNPRLAAKDEFDKRWKINPSQFDPMGNAIDRERIERTWKLLQLQMDPEFKGAVDLGCGYGILSQRLAERGIDVTALDVSGIPLERLSGLSNITVVQDFVPKTLLPDEHYDIVLCTEIIGYLPDKFFRLFFSELARLVKREGVILCSTEVDIQSDDALQRFIALAETEITAFEWVFSYHYLYIKMKKFFNKPQTYADAGFDQKVRKKEMEKRKITFFKTIYRVNTSKPVAYIWKGLSFLLKPLIDFLDQSQAVMLILEKISRFLWQERAITHVILIGKRRPLIEPQAEAERPVERKTRKQVWE